MSGISTVQPDFFETGLGGVLRVVSAPTQVPHSEPRETHRNSRASYHGTVNLRRDRCSIILGLFQDNPARAFTDREVLARIYPGSGDLNMVRPRITELIELGALVEAESVKCTVTGKTVRACVSNTRVCGSPLGASTQDGLVGDLKQEYGR